MSTSRNSRSLKTLTPICYHTKIFYIIRNAKIELVFLTK